MRKNQWKQRKNVLVDDNLVQNSWRSNILLIEHCYSVVQVFLDWVQNVAASSSAAIGSVVFRMFSKSFHKQVWIKISPVLRGLNYIVWPNNLFLSDWIAD